MLRLHFAVVFISAVIFFGRINRTNFFSSVMKSSRGVISFTSFVFEEQIVKDVARSSPSTYLIFGEVLWTVHLEWHNLRYCMDCFSVYTSKHISPCLLLSTISKTQGAMKFAPTISPFLDDCWQNRIHRKIDKWTKWNVKEDRRWEIVTKIKHTPPEDMHQRKGAEVNLRKNDIGRWSCS